MKVLIFNELYRPNVRGGAEVSVQLLAEGLGKLGHEITVCTISDKDKEDDINGVHIHYLKFKNLYWEFEKNKASRIEKIVWHICDIYNYRYCRDVKKIIRKHSPDVIHTHNLCGFSIIVWHIAKQFGIPIVHTLRDYYLMCYKTTMFSNKNCENQCLSCKLASLISKKESANIKAVIGISNFILKIHKQNNYFKNTIINEVIPNSVGLIRGTSRCRNSNIIGYMGAISPSKGIERLMSDFCRLESPDYKLQIAGTGDANYYSYLSNKYKNDNIEFVGRVAPEEFLSKISVLVVPSEWNEPFGRVVIEAIAVGCPVIVSNRGGLGEIVNNQCGYIFDIEDPNSLYYLLKERKYENLQSHIVLDEVYSTHEVAKRYLNVYLRAINK